MRTDDKMAGWSLIVGNRIGLDLYANIRPVKLLPGVKHLISGRHMQVWEPRNVDTVFIRENTEDRYAGSGGILAPGGEVQVATDTRHCDGTLVSAGERIDAAVRTVLRKGERLTYGLVGPQRAASGTAVTDAIISELTLGIRRCLSRPLRYSRRSVRTGCSGTATGPDYSAPTKKT